MRWHIALALPLVGALLAGCTANLPTDGIDPSLTTPLNLFASSNQTWVDPQNFPHPAYNWATLPNLVNGTLPKWWMPINGTPLPDHISGLAHMVNVGGNVTQGSGIAIFGSIAVVPDDALFANFVDISEPTKPVLLGQVESSGRGAAIIAFPDGRLITAIATTAGFDVIEFTDPTNPVMLNQTSIPVNGGHKLGIVPGTPILYNAGSQGGDPGIPGVVGHPLYGPGLCNIDIAQCTGYTEIYNLTDPARPALVQNFQNGLSCHHIFFWNAPDGSKQRAICAGIQYTQIWDTANPLDPKVIVSIPVHHGVPGTPSAMASIEAFSHSAGMNIAGNILYVGDESGGGSTPPGCVASVNGPLGAISVPVGATWFYDISTETSPSLLGYYSPAVGPGTYTGGVPSPADPTEGLHSTSCTTHHGRIVPDKEGRDLLAMSYYGDGVVLLDFTGISAGTLPTVVDAYADNSNTWETLYADGYLFTGDLARGMDIIGFE